MASRAGVEHALRECRLEAGAVVAHGDADAPRARRELQEDLLAFRALTARQVPTRDLRVGAIAAGVGW